MRTEIKLLRDAQEVPFQRKLNQHLENGWELHGNLLYVSSEWVQAVKRPVGKVRYRVLRKQTVSELQTTLNRAIREGSFLVSKNITYDLEDNVCVITAKYTRNLEGS